MLNTKVYFKKLNKTIQLQKVYYYMGCLPYDLTLKVVSWIIVIIYCGIIGVFFLTKRAKASKEITSQRLMFLSIAIFFFFFMGTRLLFILSDFERDMNCETVLYYQYVFGGYVCGIFAFLSITNFGETYLIKGTKHLLTIGIVIGLVIDIFIVIFFPVIVLTTIQGLTGTEYQQALISVASGIRLFNYAIQYIEIGIILILYLYLTVKSTGSLRKNCLITLLGLAISSISAFLETDAILSSGLIPPFISPAIFTVGVTVFALAYLRTIT